jgi:hypothetical protein
MRIGLALTALVVLVAGCGSPAPDGAPGLGPDVTLDEDSALGVIAGVVVDQAIRPVAGATVELEGTGRNTTTDAGGSFLLRDVEPGTHFLTASGGGISDVQTSVEVRAGEVSRVKLQGVYTFVPMPFHETHKFSGHIDFYGGYGHFAVQVVADAFAPGALPCNCFWNVTAGPEAKTFVVEGDGQVTVPDATGEVHSVYWEFVGDYLGDNQDIRSGLTEFPFTTHIDAESFDNSTDQWLLRVTGGLWPSGQMDFDLFVTVFYREPAPDGWSLIAGDT